MEGTSEDDKDFLVINIKEEDLEILRGNNASDSDHGNDDVTWNWNTIKVVLLIFNTIFKCL